MSFESVALRNDLTPCLLHPSLLLRGGGLARAIVERASLFARHYGTVVILTTGFVYRIDEVVAELKERGSLHERVVVRNFFQHSEWVENLGVPPVGAEFVFPRDQVESKRQRMPGGPFFRIADRRVDKPYPTSYRYFDQEGRSLLTTRTWPKKRHEYWATVHQPEDHDIKWGPVVARWVDSEMAGLTRPVLFSLQREFGDPVLLASTKAARKVVSLHNCHYLDPEDPSSGFRPAFRPILSRPFAVDEVVCLTQQQRLELAREIPGASLRSIPYPGRPPRHAMAEKDLSLVVFVGSLQKRKRVDHAIRAFALVVRDVPQARLEIYGEGPTEAALRALIDDLELQKSVTLMGYSLAVEQAQSRAACTLMTSTFEGFGRVISESMSLGTPVVAYDVRYGPRDLIRHEIDGLMVPLHEPEALAEAIVSLLSRPERALEMGVRASEIVQRLPIEDFERAWLDVLSARNRWRTRPTVRKALRLTRRPGTLVRGVRRRFGAAATG